MISLTNQQKTALEGKNVIVETIFKLYPNTTNRHNRIYDSSFDISVPDETQEWVLDQFAKTAAESNIGTNSLLVNVASGSATQFLTVGQQVTEKMYRVELGKKYVLSFYHKGTVNAGFIDVGILTDSGTIDYERIDATAADWTRHEIPFTLSGAGLTVNLDPTLRVKIVSSGAFAGTSYIDNVMLHEDFIYDDASWDNTAAPWISMEPIIEHSDDGIVLPVTDYEIHQSTSVAPDGGINMPSGTVKFENAEGLFSPFKFNGTFSIEDEKYIGKKQGDGFGAIKTGNRVVAYEKYTDQSDGSTFYVDIGVFTISNISQDVESGEITFELANYWSDLAIKSGGYLMQSSVDAATIIKKLVYLAGYNPTEANLSTQGYFYNNMFFFTEEGDKFLDILSRLAVANKKQLFVSASSVLTFQDIIGSPTLSSKTIDYDKIASINAITRNRASAVIIRSDPYILTETNGYEIDQTKQAGNIDQSTIGTDGAYFYTLGSSSLLNPDDVDLNGNGDYAKLFDNTTNAASHDYYFLGAGDGSLTSDENAAPYFEIDLGTGGKMISAIHLWLYSAAGNGHNHYIKVKASLDQDKWYYLAGSKTQFAESNPNLFEDHRTVINNFAPVYARYVRVYMNGGVAETGAFTYNRIWDISFYRNSFSTSMLLGDGSGFGTISLESGGIRVWKNENHCDDNITFQLVSRTGHTRIRGRGISTEPDPILHIAGTCDAGLKIWDGYMAAYNCAGVRTFEINTENGNLTVIGTVCAGAGNIGGFTIGATSLTAGAGDSAVGMSSDSGCPGFWTGNITGGSAPFRAYHNGCLVASNAYITGTVCANAGHIASWCINAGFICSDNAVLFSGAANTARLEMCKNGTAYSAGVNSGDAQTDVAFWAGCCFQCRSKAPFRVCMDGSIVAENAIICGTICACVGYIAGFKICTTDLAAGVSNATAVGMSSSNSCPAFWTGHLTGGSAPFRVTHDGCIISTAGTIAGWAINSACISATNIKLVPGAAGVAHIATGTCTTTCYAGIASGDAAGCVAFWAGCCLSGIATAPFHIHLDGTGLIGGFEISGTMLCSTPAAGCSVGMSSCTTSGCVAFWAGNSTVTSAPFRVTNLGAITAICGTVGGWTLATSSLTGGNVGICATGWMCFGTENDFARIDASNDDYRIWVGNATAGSAPFRVCKTGAIVATAGCIAGWSLDTCIICAPRAGINSCDTDGTIALWLGHATPASACFRVTNQGCVFANCGTIGGWTLQTDKLCSTNIALIPGAVGTSHILVGTGATAAGIASADSADDVTFWAGDTFANRATADFWVNAGGCLCATLGTIGSWTITSSCLHSTNIALIPGAVGTSHFIVGTGATAGGISSADSADDITIWSGSTFANRATANFRVNAGGCANMTCATISGAITAESGTIGGWCVTAACLYRGKTGMASCETANCISFWAGHATAVSAPFQVSNCGCLYAICGSVGGWTLGSDFLCTSGILIGATGCIQSKNFCSGLTGWKITTTGDAEFAAANIRGELRSAVFVYDEIHAVGGEVYIAGSSILCGCSTTPVALACCFVMCIKHPPSGAARLFQTNEILRVKTFNGTGVYDVWSRVCCYCNCGTYAHYCVGMVYGSLNAVIPAGTTVISYGQPTTCCGLIRLNGQGSCSPFIDIFTNGTCPWCSSISARARLGQLCGITGENEFGLWTNNGKIVGGVVQSSNYDATHGSCISLTDGTFKFGGGSTTPTLSWDGSALCVVGCIDTVCDFYHNTVRFITTRDTNNVFVGTNAGPTSLTGCNNTGVGNTALCSLTSGCWNTGVGDGSGRYITTGIYNTFVGSVSAYYCTITGCGNTGVGYGVNYLLTTGLYNTSVGWVSMRNVTSGCYNTAVGTCAMYCATTPLYTTAIGYFALGECNLTGAGNTAIGSSVLRRITSGAYNTGIGYVAGLYITTGLCNVIIGSCAAYNSTNASNNTIIGTDAVKSGVLTGGLNVIIGACTGILLTVADYNTVVGACALNSANCACHNTAVGYRALYCACCCSTGPAFPVGNTAIGMFAAKNLLTGCLNTAIGYSSMGNALSTGLCNVAIGYASLYDITSGNQNVAIGSSALENLSTGCGNVAIGNLAVYAGVVTGNYNSVVGFRAADKLTSGAYNVVLGSCAAACLTTGACNVILGSCAMYSISGVLNTVAIGADIGKVCVTTGDNNVLIGYCAVSNLTSGYCNVVIGTNAASGMTTGYLNTFIGSDAVNTGIVTGYANTTVGTVSLRSLTTGIGNTNVGYCSMGNLTTGCFNLSLGYWAMSAGVVTGLGNYAIGYDSLTDLTSGCYNIGVGQSSLSNLTTGCQNIAIGHAAMYCCIVTGIYNIAIGTYTLGSTTSGSYNVALGYRAGLGLTTGTCNVIIGSCALYSASGVLNTVAIGADIGKTCTTTGDDNVLIGFCSATNLTSGYINTIIGTCSSQALTTGYANTIIGALSGVAATTGCYNTFLGYAVNYAGATTGNYNTGIGSQANRNLTTGCYNTSIGYLSQCGLTTGCFNTSVGSYSLGCCAVTGIANTAIGYVSLYRITSGTFNVGVGYYAGSAITTGHCNVAIGSSAGYAMTSGCHNTFVGNDAVKTGIVTGNCNVVVGACSVLNLTSGVSNVVVGSFAGTALTTGVSNVAIGNLSLNSVNVGCYNTAIGYAALWCACCCSTGPLYPIGNTAIGYNAAAELLTGCYNTAIGNYAMGWAGRSTGNNNTAIGASSLLDITTGCSNVGVGVASLANLTTGCNNVAVGYNALCSITTVSDLIAIGYNALAANTSGTSNIALGQCALASNTTGNYLIAIGQCALLNNIGSGTSIAIGRGALLCQTCGMSNIAVGDLALSNAIKDGITSCRAMNNIAIGDYALGEITTGCSNIAIGVNAGSAIATCINSIAIGNVGANVSNYVWLGNANTVCTNIYGSTIVCSSATTGTLCIGRNGWADDGTYFCKIGGQPFYITSGTGTTYIYSASIYLGSTSGTSVISRCNHYTGCCFCITGTTGAACFAAQVRSAADLYAGTCVQAVGMLYAGTCVCATNGYLSGVLSVTNATNRAVIICSACCALYVRGTSTWAIEACGANGGIYGNSATNSGVYGIAPTFGVYGYGSTCLGVVGCACCTMGVMGSSVSYGVYGCGSTCCAVVGNTNYGTISSVTTKVGFRDIEILPGLRTLCIPAWHYSDRNSKGFETFVGPMAEDVQSAWNLTFSNDGLYTMDGIALKATQELDIIVSRQASCIDSLASCIEGMALEIACIKAMLLEK